MGRLIITVDLPGLSTAYDPQTSAEELLNLDPDGWPKPPQIVAARWDTDPGGAPGRIARWISHYRRRNIPAAPPGRDGDPTPLQLIHIIWVDGEMITLHLNDLDVVLAQLAAIRPTPDRETVRAALLGACCYSGPEPLNPQERDNVGVEASIGDLVDAALTLHTPTTTTQE